MVLAGLTAAGASPAAEFRPGLFGPDIAIYGSRKAYRYLLTRRFAPGPLLTWVMLNPSTATAWVDDPTIARCWRRAVLRQWRGITFGGITVLNLFALRATDPAELARHPDPAGPGNDACLRAMCPPGSTVVAAWGAHKAALARGPEVATMLAAAGVSLLCLGRAKAGQPRHPLLVPMATGFEPYQPIGATA